MAFRKSYELQPTHLGGGTVEFKNAIDIPQDEIIPYLDGLKNQWREENFTIVNDDDGNPLHAVNKGGFIYDLESMRRAPVRIQHMKHPFFVECENAIYQALIRYVEEFPALLQSIWWRSGGHVLCYDEGASLGFHSDNDVNYRYGSIPQLQHATRNVVSVLIYFNSCTDEGASCKYGFTGGHMTIPYFDIDLVPITGSIVFMSANYLGAHQIHEVTSGSRYSYLSWFAQGSEDAERGIKPIDSTEDIGAGGQWWVPRIIEDYANHLSVKYGDSIPDGMLAYTSRKQDHKY